jgi:hypothetical protein
VALARAPGPKSAAARTFAAGFSVKRRSFLDSETARTARLGGFYRQLRLEVEEYLRSGDTTASDEAFYGSLLRKVDVLLAGVKPKGSALGQWVAQSFVEGVTLQGGEVVAQPVHDQALRFLSGYALDLIQDTEAGVRRVIQQEVAQATAGSISRPELVERITASGLTEGPWRDVETRAMVIARTEQMRAYTAGNIAGIRSNGAVIGEWIAALDERVCPICSERDGGRFVLPGVSDEELLAAGVVPGKYERLGPVTQRGIGSAPPAHPRCRCTLRARYRDEAGNVLGTPQGLAGTAPPPATPVEAAGVEVGPRAPTLGDMIELAQLTDLKPDRFQAVTTYWRELPTPMLLDIFRQVSLTPELALQTASNLLATRYSVTLRTDDSELLGRYLSRRGVELASLRRDMGMSEADAAKGDPIIVGLLEAIESYAPLGFDWRGPDGYGVPIWQTFRVVHSLGRHPLEPGADTPAHFVPAESEIAWTFGKLVTEGDERPGMSYRRATMTHELAHALQYGPGNFASGLNAATWEAIHKASDPAQRARLEQSRAESEKWIVESSAMLKGLREQLDNLEADAKRDGLDDQGIKTRQHVLERRLDDHRRVLESYTRQRDAALELLAKLGAAEPLVDDYGRHNNREDFATSMEEYVYDAERFRSRFPRRGAWMDELFRQLREHGDFQVERIPADTLQRIQGR